MTAIVINTCYGGFSISEAARERMRALGSEHADTYCFDIPRDDPHLVTVVREMGETAGNRFTRLKVVEIPDGIEWHIDEYDGLEEVHEAHRSWS